jgi:Rps23 Pro-64 3,4-dihydroxylase Tpa1-like proline 4-hydroxylase
MVLTAKVLRDFELRGVAVVDGAMALDGEVGNRALRAELTEWGEGRLQPTFQMQARQDVVGWMSPSDAEEAGVATAAAMALLKGCAYELNEGLGLGLAVPQQCMCACYEGDGAHYVAHRDNVCVDSKGEVDCHNSREVTAILYTSDAWSEDDGGCLRFYRTANDDETGEGCEDYTDVAPLAGRMVIFRSRTVLHEVRPSYAKRTALSLWMLRTNGSPPIV